MKKTHCRIFCIILGIVMLVGMFPTTATAMTVIEEPPSGAFEILTDMEFVSTSDFTPPEISGEAAEKDEIIADDSAKQEIITATPTDSPQLSQAIPLSAEENGITFPVSFVRENALPSRLRGVSTLHIEWANGYDYDFPLAPGFPIYGKWSIYWVDSQLVYCVEPRNLVSTEGKLLSTANDWSGLSDVQQRMWLDFCTVIRMAQIFPSILQHKQSYGKLRLVIAQRISNSNAH